MQNYDWPAFKRIYIGASGTGKTSLCWRHFVSEKARFKFIYDHKAMEFSRRYKVQPCFTAKDMFDSIKRGSEIICFCPMKVFAGEPERGFEVFCDFLFNISEHIPGRKLFLCDELQKVVGSYARPKPLLNICDMGRTYQIDCFFIASASNAIHNLVRGQLTECYCFNHKGDCQWEMDNGFDETQLRQLKRGQWLWRDLDHGGETKTGGNIIGNGN